jgi:bifunctional DNA-binding transcriptional regulator/antitoxin component of YhaV-PrlF toxin-antitoxin module
VVIPKALRNQVGLRPGEIEVVVDGAGLRIEPVTGDEIEDVDGRLVVPASGQVLTVDDVRAIRDADQR